MEFQDECHECGYSKFKEYELEKHLHYTQKSVQTVNLWHYSENKGGKSPLF